MKIDYEIKFWKEWLEGDLLKRLKLVENLLIIRDYVKINKLPEKYRKEMLANSLNSLFEDFESAVYTKISLENKKLKNRKK